ncbi:hypothetical protein A1O1_04740 [Capronia coronata CBS 617.96]|uniref:histidine kinase n=1 Tax=Capronia coronata CBS 617.96 TaxID=1182541 RepID=W9Y5K8_9EURO|nr:uncharacterized protein A1O1_04740 [Capronia coronata CBS 617.96]EXJ87813.1 hypothetical protein A1O1_04740 [Capronia coronata CBS 617.96]
MAREGARERDMHRYYKPWLETFISADLKFDLKPTLHLPPNHAPEDSVPRSSRDKALTAFAQLGCLRLQAKRGVVTLFDSSKQYIIAEATKSLSLMDDSQHEPGDALWFGNTYIAREKGVSADAMYPDTYTAQGPDGASHSAPALVVPDLSTHEKYKSREYAGRGVSFYCGVPITTKLGHVIGVYTVTDDKPRAGLLPDQLRFMTDMATIVVQHLEVVKNDRARARGESLIQGIGTFIEGDITEEVSLIDPAFQAHPPPSLGQAAAAHDAVGSEPPTSPANAKLPEPNGMANGSIGLDDGHGGPPEDEPTAPGDDHDLKDDGLLNELQRRKDLGVVQNDTIGPDPRRLRAQRRSAAVKEKALSDSLHVFDRAAAILRECLGVDGVAYVNASSANLSSGSNMKHAGLAVAMMHHSKTKDKRATDREARHKARQSSRESSADGGQRESASHESSDSNSSSSTARSGPESSSSRPMRQRCEVLGISPADSERVIRIPEQTVRRFVRRNPQGRCFAFDEYGKPASSDETSDSASTVPEELTEAGQPSKGPRHIPTTNALLRAFPGARKIVFLPLWDFAKGRWHSGMVIWSHDANRMTNIQDDLSYLKAFNNAVMNEVNRINLALSDTAKATFLANISHELRSPLHGILGSIEFLHDTPMDDFQSSMVISVETCGKTLLDTVNHVLDYAKINSLSKGGSLRPGSPGTQGNAQPSSSDSSLVEDFDMAIVVEEAVEAVYAGQVFRTANADGLSARGPGEQTAADRAMRSRQAAKESISKVSAASSSRVRLTLNIDNFPNWKVRSQPGAIRRIVMNVLGNALKYTSKGSINVALELDESRKKSSSNLHVLLKVTDTGRGMSGEFMKNHAFTAFSQEDSLASGTGLGLSIVRQIVDSLKGKIDLSSEKDVGTEIRIWLSLPKSLKEETADSETNVVTQVRALTKGLDLCMLLPDFVRSDDDDAPRTLRPLPTVEDCIRTCMERWFGMKVRCAPNMEGDAPNFFVYPEPPPIDYLMDRHGRTASSREIPVIVLCTNAFEAASLRSHGIHRLTDIGRIIEVIAQPCGPQKLAKVLQRCMRRMKLLGDSDSAGSKGQVSMSMGHGGPADLATVSSADAVKTQGSTEGELREGEKEMEKKSKSSRDTARPREPPLTPDQSTTDRDSDWSARPVDKKEKARVLVVDDNHINLHLLVTFVRKTNHPHQSATDGEKALEAYRRSVLEDGGRHAFKYILMDISMPVMNGIVATREIRKFEKEQRVERPTQIIALTGLGTESAQNEAYQAGFDHFLSKPIKFKDLQKLLL